MGLATYQPPRGDHTSIQTSLDRRVDSLAAMGQLDGRTAVITGAGSGIGRATTLSMVEAGARVVLVDADRRGAQETLAQVAAGGAACLLVEADVSSADDVSRAISDAVSSFGSVDILCNNAAINVPGGAAEVAPSDWDAVIAVNLRGPYLAARAALPHMLERKRGAIINISSVDGLLSEAQMAAYCASKAGLISLTKSLTLDYGRDGIRANCICPGTTETPAVSRALSTPAAVNARLARTPLGRFLSPGEIADVAVFLASDAASALMGSVVVVDGGLSAGWTYSEPVAVA